MAPKKSIGKGPGPRGLTDATKVKALLDESKIRPDALIPLQSGSALGPVYEGECSESLEDFYPGDPEHLPFHSIDPVWTEYFKGTPNRLWPKPTPEYNAWFLRVAEAKGAQWKRNGLYDIIFLSTQEIFLDKGLFLCRSPILVNQDQFLPLPLWYDEPYYPRDMHDHGSSCPWQGC